MKIGNFKIIAFTHKSAAFDQISKLHQQEDLLKENLQLIRKNFGVSELMFLSTCNRLEFLLVTSSKIDTAFLSDFFKMYDPGLQMEDITWATENVCVYEGELAVKHLLNVASSLDSLVIGEREIITQVRNAYDLSNKWNLSGDMIRLIVKHTIETAKRVYTETNVARNPVSVVSLAYRKLRELHVKLNARFILIGAGITNTNMARYLKKHGFNDFTVFNRTLANAQKLATELSGEAHPLSDLINYKNGFDVIVTCTGASSSIISKPIYEALTAGEKGKKIVIDLAVPNDLDDEVLKLYNIHFIAVNNLQEIAKNNLHEREKELTKCNEIIGEGLSKILQILKTRKVELAMIEIPKKIKEIHHTAINEVFAKDMENLDQQSKEVLNKILSYVEKKYISMPMKMAKDILLGNSQ